MKLEFFSNNMSAENISRRQVLKMIFGVAASGLGLVVAGCSGEKSTNSIVNATPIPGILLGCKNVESGDKALGIASSFGAGPQDRLTVQRGSSTIYDGPANDAPGLEVTVPRNIAGTPMPELTISDDVCVYKNGQ